MSAMDFSRALAPIWKGVGLSASLTLFMLEFLREGLISLWDPRTLGAGGGGGGVGLVRACSAFQPSPPTDEFDEFGKPGARMCLFIQRTFRAPASYPRAA